MDLRLEVRVQPFQDLLGIPQDGTVSSAQGQSVSIEERPTNCDRLQEGAFPVLRKTKPTLNEDVVALHKPFVPFSCLVKVQVVKALDVGVTPEGAVLALALSGRCSRELLSISGALPVATNFQGSLISDANAITVLKDNLLVHFPCTKSLTIGEQPDLACKPSKRLVLHALSHVAVSLAFAIPNALHGLATHTLNVCHCCAR
mmetsp:Transcript_47947/g.88231  ORF Transcript_47947/g.88231 Transcript_47947/m.88231 type:complete len:202 (-) Transcript_47947:1034-1639(-)